MTASSSCNSAMRRRVLRGVAAAICWAVIAAGAIAFAFFYCTTPTRWFNVRATELIAWRNTLVLQYNFANATTGRATALLPGSLSFMLIWQWCGTLAVALGSAGLMWLASAPSSGSASVDSKVEKEKVRPWCLGAAARKSVTRARRLLRCRVPPGRLWRTLLGPDGLSLLDLLLILLWIGLHILWMHEMIMRTLDNRRAAPPPPKPIVRSPPTAKTSAPATSPSNATAIPPPRALTNPITSTTPSTTGRRLMQTASAPSPSAGGNATSPLPSTSPSTAKSPTANATSPPPKANAAPPPTAKKLKPLPEVVQDGAAKYFGWVGRLDILLLFFPLPRCNFLHWLVGSDFPAMVKYHRWLGHGTLMVYSLHGITYMSMWTHAGTLSSMLYWGMDAGVNRLSGLVALCGGWLLWVTSIPFVRRRLFNLFYGCHILGAVVFMLFAFMHRKDVATWVMPGVFLYLLDVVLRTIQQNFNCVKLTSTAATGDDSSCAATARVSPDGGIMSLNIDCHQSVRWVGGDIVFLNVPAVSWWQWHPFTLASAPSPSSEGSSHTMQLHIKKYNRWTQRLISRMSSGSTPVALYVSGPYDSCNRKWIKGYDTHVFVAGGIGVTPTLGMIRELIASRRSNTALSAAASAGGSEEAAGGGRVVLVWVSRTIDELKVLPYEILQEANACRGSAAPWLDVRLFLTGGAAGKGASSPQDATIADVDVKAALQSADLGGRTSSGGASSSSASAGNIAGKADGKGATTSDVYGTRARPLAHPYAFSPLLWMAAVVLCFGGGFTGLICAQSYDAHISRTVAVRRDFSYVGMLQFAALGLGAVLPPSVLMLAVHLYRRFSRLSTFSSPFASATAASATLSEIFPPPTTTATATVAISTADVKQSAFALKPLPLVDADIESYISYGRPDLAELLDQIAKTGKLTSSEKPGQELTDSAEVEAAVAAGVEGLRVAVYAAGPEPLVGSVAALCGQLNGLWGRSGRAYLDFHATTHEL
ncbi:hypothetical protein PLESTM_001015500 [Pleodorina starrii]|nr:hypothetical protein PLESTM_001015500 [Pleodorina starrii]